MLCVWQFVSNLRLPQHDLPGAGKTAPWNQVQPLEPGPLPQLKHIVWATLTGTDANRKTQPCPFLQRPVPL